MLLYYVRHGDPVYDPDGLTPLGHKQAQALAERLAAADLDELFASTSVRAQQTAAPTAQRIGKVVKLLDWCNEAHAWEEFTLDDDRGRRWLYQDRDCVQRFASDEIARMGNDWYKHPWFCSDRLTAGMERIRCEVYAFLAELGYSKATGGSYYTATNPNDKRIALFAHEGFGVAFLSTLTGIPYPTFCTRLALQHSGVTAILFEGEGNVVPQILQLNNDSHLFKTGLPTNFNNGIKI